MEDVRYVKSGFKKDYIETYMVNGIMYRSSNKRMLYNPEIHFNHGKLWTVKELVLLVKLREENERKWSEISIELGRTHDTCYRKYSELRNSEEIETYRKMKI